jgi:curli biogenesis system outer membrane secretion channel CsgG
MKKILVTALVAAGLAAPAIPAFAQTTTAAPATMDHAAPAKHKKKVPHKKTTHAPKAETKAE